LFFPRDRELGDERPTVLFSLLNSYPAKGYARGVETARALLDICKRNKKEIRVMAYGTLTVPQCPELIGLGTIPQTQLAHLLGTEVDVFCDPSTIHSYGLPSLEAIASGVVPICWDNKGIREYANQENAKILDPQVPASVLANEIYNYVFGEKLKPNNISNSVHLRSTGVRGFVKILNENFGPIRDKGIAIVTPHLRKHGGPTTILTMAEQLKERGHDVKLYTVYPDINPEVIGETNIPIFVNWKEVAPCDALIVNSDNEHNDFFSKYPFAKKKIMLKLSHNARFQQLEDQSLTYDWDHIVTSTDWLVGACEKPMTEQGWTHPPKEATRVGWYHYGHERFSCPPNLRSYGTLDSSLRISFLAHHHILKGTKEAIRALDLIKRKYPKVEVVAIGEWPDFAKNKPEWVNYIYSPNRKLMAEILQGTDIWLTASHTEGLGRMALEAMSASCAVVMTDTSAEFAQNKKNCLVVPKGNFGAMSKAIDKLLNDKDLFTNIVKNGYETASQYADPTEFIDNLEEVICAPN